MLTPDKIYTLPDYEFYTNPFPHQFDWFVKTRDHKVYAIFWEQQTGKTKLIIDTAIWLFNNGKIGGLLVVAPNGVHRNWLTDELPVHMPPKMLKQTCSHVYQSKRASTKWHQKEVRRVTAHKGFSVLAMTYTGFVTKRGKEAAWNFMQSRELLYVLDEAHHIKSTKKGARSQSFIKSGRYVKYKRILTGTPVSNGPFDIYSPMRFLSPAFWVGHGFKRFEVFRHHFGVFREAVKERMTKSGPVPVTIKFPVGYQRLDQLHNILKPVSTRITKDKVLPGLPPKVYNKLRFDLTPKQRAIYDEFKTEFMVELDDGLFLSEPLAIVRLLRLHQITSNYVPTDDEFEEPTVEIDPGNNPRLESLLGLLEDIPRQAIIWARFTMDIDQIMEELKGQAVRYDGQVSDDQRAENKAIFQRGDAKYFVGNAQAGAEGLSLKMAKYVIYYNNSFKLLARQQSEDRAHGIGQDEQVGYWDLVANDTVDIDIVRNLVKKVNISNIILGDKFKEWL